MPDDIGKPPPEPTACAAQRFDVPDFMVPQSIADVRELARMIALAEWAPDSYRDIEGNYLQQKIELAIMHGATVGLGPIAAVQSIAVIDGMPTIWGDGALAIVERCGLLEDMVEDYQFDAEQGLTAICTMRRRRRPTPITNRFSMAMAEQARLTQKEGPWQSYPQRMLKMRARSWTIRDGFADVLRGLHIREEVDDFIEARGLSPALVNRAQDMPSAAPRPRRTPFEPKSPVEVPPVAMTVREAAERPGADVGEEPDASEAEMLGPAQDESFTLADAEGGFIEVTGAEALRSEFDRIFFDKHLAPGQILGVWESNDRARAAIERLFGAEALDPAAERMRSAQVAREEPAGEDDAGNDHPPEREPQEQEADPGSGSPPDAPKPRPARAGRGTAKSAPATDRKLVVVIDPTWGDRKVFRHYRASLTAFQPNGSATPRFRAANSAIETRLRMKLPQQMREIDALYDGGPEWAPRRCPPCDPKRECEGGGMAIALSPVTSSQIAAVGYDAATNELVIRFHSSGRKQERVYSYDGVPSELARGLIAAESPGSYFHRHIRRGPYPYRRHEGEGLRQNEPLGREARR